MPLYVIHNYEYNGGVSCCITTMDPREMEYIATRNAPALSPFLFGHFGAPPKEFDPDRLRKDWHAPYYVLLSLIRRFTARSRRLFGGDAVMAMVAIEIWLYNVGRFAERHGEHALTRRLGDIRREQEIPKCNAYSVALALELSPETVRRKIAKLLLLGWVARSEKGDLFVTDAWEHRMLDDVGIDTMRDCAASIPYLQARLQR